MMSAPTGELPETSLSALLEEGRVGLTHRAAEAAQHVDELGGGHAQPPVQRDEAEAEDQAQREPPSGCFTPGD